VENSSNNKRSKIQPTTQIRELRSNSIAVIFERYGNRPCLDRVGETVIPLLLRADNMHRTKQEKQKRTSESVSWWRTVAFQPARPQSRSDKPDRPTIEPWYSFFSRTMMKKKKHRELFFAPASFQRTAFVTNVRQKMRPPQK
jgi:hypothetical protein